MQIHWEKPLSIFILIALSLSGLALPLSSLRVLDCEVQQCRLNTLAWGQANSIPFQLTQVQAFVVVSESGPEGGGSHFIEAQIVPPVPPEPTSESAHIQKLRVFEGSLSAVRKTHSELNILLSEGLTGQQQWPSGPQPLWAVLGAIITGVCLSTLLRPWVLKIRPAPTLMPEQNLSQAGFGRWSQHNKGLMGLLGGVLIAVAWLSIQGLARWAWSASLITP